jgi:hypothetical protein
MSSPTSRSLEECRRRGWLAEVVEKWIPQTKQRKDLWGFVDLVAITPDGRTIGIQATSGANHAARVAKIQDSPKIDAVLNAGWIVEVWSYTKRKVKRGGTAVRWVLREERVTLADHKTEAFNPDTSGLIPFLRGELRDATKTKG